MGIKFVQVSLYEDGYDIKHTAQCGMVDERYGLGRSIQDAVKEATKLAVLQWERSSEK